MTDETAIDRAWAAGETHEYWRANVMGLSETGARQLLEHARHAFDLDGDVVDPDEWYSRSLDVETAETLAEALRSLIRLDPAEGEKVLGLLEDVQLWLDERRPVAANDT